MPGLAAPPLAQRLIWGRYRDPSRMQTAVPLRMSGQNPASGTFPEEPGTPAATQCASGGRSREWAPGGPVRHKHAVAPGSETPACRSCSSLPASCPQGDLASPSSRRHHRHDRNMQSKLHSMFALWTSHDASDATTLLPSNTEPSSSAGLELRVRSSREEDAEGSPAGPGLTRGPGPGLRHGAARRRGRGPGAAAGHPASPRSCWSRCG